MSANAQTGSKVMTARVEAAALAAFDAYAVARGGRGAVLRQLIDQALRDAATVPRIASFAEPATTRISLRFTDVENAVLAHRAAQRSTDRSGWIKALEIGRAHV